ncbi:hypothetical protein TELCIR_24642, partial [Teladorsagia circumcincta]
MQGFCEFCLTSTAPTVNLGNIRIPSFGNINNIEEVVVVQATNRVPLSQLGLSEKEIYTLCAKFAPVAAKYCYVSKVEEQFIEKCRGYNQDCAQFQAKHVAGASIPYLPPRA